MVMFVRRAPEKRIELQVIMVSMKPFFTCIFCSSGVVWQNRSVFLSMTWLRCMYNRLASNNFYSRLHYIALNAHLNYVIYT